MKGVAAGVATVVVALGVALAAAPSATRGPFEGRPDAVVDLNTKDGLALMRASWTVRDVTLTPATFRRVAPDLTPTGPEAPTFDVGPRPGTPAFDRAPWVPMPAGGLLERVGPGRTSFAWYRLRATVPRSIGDFETTGASAVFEIVVDDYAEVWVNGTLTRSLGQSGGSLVAGFNAPNRVVLTREARPGQAFDIAVFAANGPLSDPPANYIWVRSAAIDFYRPRPDARRVHVTVDQRDARARLALPDEPVLEHLASGFQFTEGPVWNPADQSLLFSDPNDNTIYRWRDEDGVSVFRVKSGYTGADIGLYHQPGSNGLALDSQGRLTIAEHGNRRVTRLEKNGALTILADRHQGKRLNSPNDLVYRSDGALYFTDPPFGLPRVFDDPLKELSTSGVFRLKDGRLDLLSTDLEGPNGIAFSPDERYLYVTNWDVRRKVIMRYEVAADGTLAAGRVFFDMTGAPGEDALDGVKVDDAGDLFVSGPGGLWVLDAAGVHLATVRLPELAANMAWGDDGRSLYLTARTGLYRLRTRIGRSPAAPATVSR
ncbi:MAG: SMP-30/gluconolactonase/LRE family protein [Vicinamibacterales bacterium]